MAQIEHLFGIDAQLLFDAGIMALNMLVLFTALSYLLFEPAKNLLAKRQERITNEREQAAADVADFVTRLLPTTAILE